MRINEITCQRQIVRTSLTSTTALGGQNYADIFGRLQDESEKLSDELLSGFFTSANTGINSPKIFNNSPMQEISWPQIESSVEYSFQMQTFCYTGNMPGFGADFRLPPILPTYADAQKAIADGGAYSVKAVSGFVVTMAVNYAGGNTDKLEDVIQKLDAAVTNFRREFNMSWGGDLPTICLDTFDEIMDRLDAYLVELDEQQAKDYRDITV